MMSCELEGVALAPLILGPYSTANKRGLSKGVVCLSVFVCPLLKPSEEADIDLGVEANFWVTNPNLDFVKQTF